jgi:16S rRNA A1518/A1519 N6-dimethyltransferase RsmA/KsgA/DIM1 with predicted DNA glycosylase/AP lyase activity
LKQLPGALDALAAIGIDSSRRAEQLSVAEFCGLAAEIASRRLASGS